MSSGYSPRREEQQLSGQAEQHVKSIEAQHQFFETIFNEFFTTLETSPPSAVQSFCDAFLAKGAECFSEQEDISDAVHYPYAYVHHGKQRKMTHQLQAIKERYHEGGDVIADIVELIDDCKYHMLHEDTRLIDWVRVRAVMLGES